MFGWHKNEEGYTREDGYKSPLGAISGIGVILVILFMIARPYLSQQGALHSMSSEQGADAALTGDAEAGRLMTLIKARYPDDYRRIVAAVQAKAGAGDMDAVRSATERLVGALVERESRYLAQAPDAALIRIVDVQFSLLDELHNFPNDCMRFISGVMLPRELRGESRPKLEELAILRLTAMADGHQNPAGRSAPILDAATGKALEDALAAQGASRATLDILGGKRLANQASYRVQCDAEYELIRAIRALPPAQRARAFGSTYSGQM